MENNQSLARTAFIYIVVFSSAYLIVGLLTPLLPEFSWHDVTAGFGKLVSTVDAAMK